MRIKEISLKNFRSYRDQVIIRDLSDVNIFIGPNSAGKSNVLEALKYIRGLVTAQQTKSFVEMAFDRDPECEIEISITFTFDRDQRNSIIDSLFKGNSNVKLDDIKKYNFLSNIKYTIVIDRNGIFSEAIRTSNIIIDAELPLIEKQTPSKGATVTNVLSVSLDEKCKNLEKLENIGEGKLVKKGDMGREFRLLNFADVSPSEQQIVTYLRNFVDSWEWFDPIRQITPRMPLGEDSVLHSSGANLTRFMNTLQTSDPRRFVELVDDAIKVLPILSDITAPPRQQEATLNVQEKGLASKIDVSNISFGMMQILILVIGIDTKKEGSIILIEEPELHLHATSQRRLFEIISRESKSKQFFLTTHSTIFTACDEHNSTYLITKKTGATKVRKIEEPKEFKNVKNVLGHRNTDLYGDECVVLIEGDSEEVALPIIAEAMEYDLVEKGIRLINVRGSGKAERMGQYLKYLKDSGVLTYVIADGNKRVKEKIGDWIRESILGNECSKVWELEFEDCFDLEIITKAMNEMSKNKGIDFEVTAEELSNARTKGKSIVKVLAKMLHEKDLPELDKPALSEKLAMFLAEDIKNNPNHKELLPELVIEEIVKTVDSRISR